MDKKLLNETICSDLYRYRGEITKKIMIREFVKNPGFRYTFIFRKCRYQKQNKNSLRYLFYKILLNRHIFKYGYEITENTQLGKGFYINHLGGIAVNPKVIIGENVNITKGVTIGRTNRGNKKGVPVIGNKVWIGANATVVGGIKIGDNVLIVPNSYVNFDVPDNSIVIGNPAKVINSEFATDGYINNIV